jgi:signal transduction histidine kinase
VKFIRPLADARRLKIQCELAPVQISGDAEKLQRVLVNLLTNAVRYNREDGEIRVTARAEGNQAVLSIADTGVGISAADLPRIFERFYRADKARTGAGNSGLGLSICKAIVEAHGGTIEAASEPGKGSVFTVRLPV